MSLVRILDRAPVNSIDEAIAIMNTIDESLPAGMNARIDRDLPDGIVQSFVALGGDPIADERRENDFDSINDILDRVEEEVKTESAIARPVLRQARQPGRTDRTRAAIASRSHYPQAS